jgi:hypothetical protein
LSVRIASTNTISRARGAMKNVTFQSESVSISKGSPTVRPRKAALVRNSDAVARKDKVKGNGDDDDDDDDADDDNASLPDAPLKRRRRVFRAWKNGLILFISFIDIDIHQKNVFLFRIYLKSNVEHFGGRASAWPARIGGNGAKARCLGNRRDFSSIHPTITNIVTWINTTSCENPRCWRDWASSGLERLDTISFFIIIIIF